MWRKRGMYMFTVGWAHGRKHVRLVWQLAGKRGQQLLVCIQRMKIILNRRIRSGSDDDIDACTHRSKFETLPVGCLHDDVGYHSHPSCYRYRRRQLERGCSSSAFSMVEMTFFWMKKWFYESITAYEYSVDLWRFIIRLNIKKTPLHHLYPAGPVGPGGV